jgi:biopolymer transport protein ExbD
MNAKAVEPMTLPVASMAQPDRDDDPDDRIILNLDRDGRLVFRYETITLARLAEILAECARNYEWKLRTRGESGLEAVPDGSRWSKLYVLVRAQKDVPWRDVQWILAELEASRFYKIQLAVSRRADRAYTPDEAAALAAEREPVLPCGTPSLVAKLFCFLRTSPVTPQEVFCDVAVTVDAGRATYSHRDRKTTNVSDLAPWIGAWLDAAPSDYRKRVGRIQAPPDTPYKYVVAALNQFHEAGLEKVDLAGIARAPEAIRNAERLPR